MKQVYAKAGMATRGLTMRAIEKAVILDRLKLTGGRSERAAELLGISPRRVRLRMQTWGVSAFDFRSKKTRAARRDPDAEIRAAHIADHARRIQRELRREGRAA